MVAIATPTPTTPTTSTPPEKPTPPDFMEFLAGVDAWVSVLAKRLAWRFDLEFEDARQSLVLALWRQHHNYDPTRGRPTTWVTVRYDWLARWINRKRSARKRERTPTSFVPLFHERDGSPIDILDKRASDPADVAEVSEDVARVRDALRFLHGPERDVIARRFGLDGADEETLRELADKCGVTKERIRQRQERGLEVLKEVMTR